MNRVKCPCCGYPTLEFRNDHEICLLCDWEDDGQDSAQAAEVRGGPNGDYSLAEAGENFKAHLIMYKDGDERNSWKVARQKKRLMKAYARFETTDNEEHWTEILILENELQSLKYR